MIDKNKVIKHYNKVSTTYQEEHYSSLDINKKYPQNIIRFEYLKKRIKELRIKNIFEVGVGEGTPLLTLKDMGLEVSGCDISEEMVKLSKAKGLNVFVGDIEEGVLRNGHDGVIAFGVMPHVDNDLKAFNNMCDKSKEESISKEFGDYIDVENCLVYYTLAYIANKKDPVKKHALATELLLVSNKLSDDPLIDLVNNLYRADPSDKNFKYKYNRIKHFSFDPLDLVSNNPFYEIIKNEVRELSGDKK